MVITKKKLGKDLLAIWDGRELVIEIGPGASMGSD